MDEGGGMHLARRHGWIPAFAGMTVAWRRWRPIAAHGWIPAFAGMTVAGEQSWSFDPDGWIPHSRG